MRTTRLSLVMVTAIPFLAALSGCHKHHSSTPGASIPQPLNVVFQTRLEIPTGSRSVRSFEVADYNADSRLDVLVAVWSDSRLRCLLAQADGSYSTTGWSQAFTSLPGELATIDLTNNGSPDVACLFPSESVVRLFENDGKGSFQQDVGSTLSVGANACGLRATDIDGDGIGDLVVCSEFGLQILIFKGTGAGSFQPPVKLSSTGAELSEVEPADLDADGRVDLVGVDLVGDRVLVWLQGSQGFTTPPTSFATGGVAPVALQAHDVNGDGVRDVVVANFVSQDLSVLLGDGKGGLKDLTLVQLSGNPWSFCIGDVNADGKQDYVASYLDRPDVGVLDGDGMGGVTGERQFGTGGWATECVAVDLDGDGKTDIVTSGIGADGLSWHRGLGAAGPAGAEDFDTGFAAPRFVAGYDVDGDGLGDVLVSDSDAGVVSVLRGTAQGSLEAHAADVLVGDLPSHISTGDLDGDGKIDAVVSVAKGVRFLLNRSTSGNVAVDVQPPVTSPPFAAGEGPFVTACAKINGDELDDLVVADFGGNKVTVFRRQGPGLSFATPGKETPIDGGPLGLDTGDFNGDGLVDVAVSRWRRGSVAVLINDGNGSFKVPQDLVAGSAPNYLAVADFDGNGVDDIVVSNLGSAFLTLFMAGREDPGFRSSLIRLGTGPASLCVHDLDADGKLDLLVTNFVSADFHVLLGDAAGQFNTSVRFPGTFVATSSALVDVDGDGLPDLVLAGLESKRVSLVLNRSVR